MERITARIVSIIMAIAIMVGMNGFVLEAYAEVGTSGSVDNPHIIMSAEQLQDINNDVTGHYKLGANIDLENNEFTPIGNADTGAFSGSFDGNGYTIKNMMVNGGKYAGLFGCNEGDIQNVTVENIDVSGTRYIGGIVGENTKNGTIKNCSVEKGNIVAEEGINDILMGGVCGYNCGEIRGVCNNSSNLAAEKNDNAENLYLGGIVGFDSGILKLENSKNEGIINNKFCTEQILCGGFVAYSKGIISLNKCENVGNINIDSSSRSYGSSIISGGIIGYTKSEENLSFCYNSGDIIILQGGTYGSQSGFVYAGGINGRSEGKAVILQCENAGGIHSMNGLGGDNYIGGIEGKGISDISQSNNTGSVYSSGYIGNFANFPDFEVGGIYGCSYGKSINCYNNGNIIKLDANGRIPSYGLGNGNLNDCYNSGAIVGTCINDSNADQEHNLYTLKSAGTKGRGLTDLQMAQIDSFRGWDFDKVWIQNNAYNNGYPYLEQNYHLMNISNTKMIVGGTLDLKVIKIPTTCAVEKWCVSNGDDEIQGSNGSLISSSNVVRVDNKGVVTCLNRGFATVTAIDNHGHKINCNIVAIEKSSRVKPDQTIIEQIVGETTSIKVDMDGKGDYLADIKSDDPNVVDPSITGSNTFVVKAKKSGQTIISFETVSGVTGHCNITVKNEAQKISLSTSSMEIKRGSTKQLKATTIPDPTSSKVTWESSDETIATVSQEGLVTGVKSGQAEITVKTDNGYADSCTVNVLEPVRSMTFVQKNVTVYKNDTANLKLVTDPADTTDSISYDSYYTSRAVLSNSSKTGVTVKGIAPGTSKITAKSSSGVTATCTVTVIEYPVIVTGISISETAKALKVGEVCKLDASVIPSNATNQAIAWESTDNTVASVSETGLVTAVGAGKAVITATSENGVIASCDVTVTGVASKNTAKIYIPQILGTDEEYVDIPVMIEHNPGINFASLKVGYDGAAMEAVEVQNGTVFGSVLGSIDKGNNEVKLSFTSAENIKEDGVLAMIRFKITSADGEKEYPVRVGYYPGEIRSKDSEAVAVNLSDGLISKSACNHTKTEVRNVVDVQCEKDGYTGDTVCSKCGYIIKTGEIIKATGHQFGEWKIVQKATYEKEGIEKRDCEKCSASETRTIPRLDKNKENKERLFGTDKWIRIAGDTRYETALKTANALKKSMDTKSFDSIIVADGNNYPDALAGSYLAKVKNAPLILVDRSVASEKMIGEYIEKNLSDKGTVYLLGGSDVVTERFEKSLKGIDVKRLAGDTRYETNLEILNEAKASKEDLLACTGEGFADSLSASAVGKPILLVDTRGLTKAQKNYLDKANVQDIYLIGGADVVSDKVGKELKSYDKDSKTERIAGDNRYKTSVDGLAGGPLAISMESPLLLVEDTAYADAKTYGSSVGISRLAVLGGTDVISDATAERILQ